MMLPTEELLRLLVGCDNEHAIILLDTAGKIIAWLGGAERIFGYSSDEVIGQPSSILFVPEDVQKQIPLFEIDVARTHRVAEDDRWMLRKDGGRIWVTGILVPLQTAAREIVGFGKILRNRTDLKGRIETLESQLDLQLTANQQKNVFISTLAHEIRNPLNAISMALELLDKIGAQNEGSIFARASIKRQIDFINRLAEDLLEVTRVSEGKVHLHLAQLTLNSVILAAYDACRPSMNGRIDKVQLIMTDAPIVIEADPDRLQQVFVNLIENALKYTPRNGNIWIKAFLEGQDAVVKVEDTGIGISPEMLPRIFDLFAQADIDERHEGAGLGIGLSVVKELVCLHGGSVHVRSDGVGRGSEFVVRLPLKGADAARPDKP